MKKSFILSIVFLSAVLFSCKKDAPAPAVPLCNNTASVVYVNNSNSEYYVYDNTTAPVAVVQGNSSVTLNITAGVHNLSAENPVTGTSKSITQTIPPCGSFAFAFPN